jgi:hypothetical protein
MSDSEIARTLAPLLDGELIAPYPGKWARPPYESPGGRTVLAADPGLSSIVLEPISGKVVLVEPSGESVINQSLQAFVACARSYTAAVNAPGVDGDDDDAWEAVGNRLLEEIRRIDPGAAAYEDEAFWSAAAEEVGYGMFAPDGPTLPDSSEAASASEAASPDSAAPGQRPKKQLLLAMSDEQRAEAFTPEQWRRLTSAVRVTIAPALPQLNGALDLMAQLAAQRGEPMPQPYALLCADTGAELAQAVEGGLLDRLHELRFICRLTPTAQSASGASRLSDIPVFTFGGENAAQQVVSVLASRTAG